MRVSGGLEVLRRRPRLVVGAVAMLVALPYLIDAYGPVEAEVMLWGAVMFAVGAGMVALGVWQGSAGARWLVIVDAVGLALMLVVLVTLMLSDEHWHRIELFAQLMLLVGLGALVCRGRCTDRLTGALFSVLAALVAAAQVPAIWSWFHFARLTDSPGPTPFETHWSLALPHVFLFGLAMSLAVKEILVARQPHSEPRAKRGSGA